MDQISKPNAPILDNFWMPFTANRQFKATPRLLAAAEGMYYTDVDGNQVLDGTAGLWCCNAGHGRKKIAQAVERQLSTMDYAPTFQMGHPIAFDFAAKLAANAPGGPDGKLDRVFFTGSGSESVDTALKIAIAYQRAIGQGTRTRIIGREKGYHGVGFGGISVGGLVNNRRVFPQIPADHMRHTLDVERNAFSKGLPAHGVELSDDLERLVQIKARYGAWLMIDEAHSLGVLGATGKGIAEHSGVDPAEVDIWMGTLSKSLVSCGGYIAGSALLIEYLKFHAAGMVYSVGLAPTVSIAALAALRLMRREPERVKALQDNGNYFLEKAKAHGLDIGKSWGYAVTPIIIGDSLRTVMLSERLLARGFAVVPVIPPGVPEKSARLRFFISAGHRHEDLDQVIEATVEELNDLETEGVSVTEYARRIIVDG